MGLYERIVGQDDLGNVYANRIPPEVFSSVLAEFARGEVTGAESRAMLEAMGAPFDDAEQAEAQALLATVASLPTPEAKIARYLEIKDVLFLGRLRAPGYAFPHEVRTRLGV